MFDDADDEQRHREDQAQCRWQMTEFDHGFLPGRSPGCSGLLCRDREHLVGTPPRIGSLGQGHKPR